MNKINSLNISGPTNIVRVEGSINGDNKVLYLFFDYHVKETKCSDYGSIDVIQLFDKFTKEAKNYNNEWDLFIEDDINYIKNKDVIDKTNYVNIYLEELRNFFNNKFSEKVNDVVKKKNNIRYHYFDLRWKINYINIVNLMNEIINYNYYKEILYNKINSIYDLILLDYDNIFKKDNKINSKFDNNKLRDVILKILNEYKKEFESLLKDFKVIISDIKNSSDKFLKKLTKDGFYDYYYEIRNKLKKFNDSYMYLNSKITDLYFLRRFLDKKYIKNGVIYSGGYHSTNIILILVKLLNFKITNVSYSKIKLLTELNNYVKEVNNNLDLFTILFPEYLIQCSSMEGFPDMFL
jgi:hypothetical protein